MSKKTHNKILFIAALVFVITAVNSHGFYHPDEHHQIVEFANAKLGLHDTQTLAWEYHSKMRPTLQPVICCLVFNIMHAFNIDNPYHQAFCLRLLTAILAFFAIHLFVKNTKQQFENQTIQYGYCLLSYFLWFIPFLSVRFASETWSGLFFLLALSFVLANSTKKQTFFTIGIFLGISFLFRFQIAFAILGLFFWLFFVNKTKFSTLILSATGFLLILALGVCLDSWFYGEFVFSPWNYYMENIVNDMASHFGTSPWYFYLLKLLSFPNYIVGICFALSFIILLIKNPKNIYIWCFIPFLFFHSLVSHKEERFLFPLAYLFAIILISAYDLLYNFIKKRKFTRILNYVLLVLFAIVNITGLLVMGTCGADKGRISMTKYVYDNYHENPLNILYLSYSNPYNPWHFCYIQFYTPNNVHKQTRINSLEELNDFPPVDGCTNLLFIKKPDLKDADAIRRIEEKGYVFIHQSVPVWVEKIYKVHDNFPNMWIYTLYEYKDVKR